MSVSDPQTAAAAATELVQELVRVFKVRRLYGPQHPQRVEVESVAARRLSSLLTEEGKVELEIQETSLRAGGEVVYEAAGTESLANILFREGLRQLVFHEGLMPDELGRFLDAVWLASQQRADDDFDLVAQLWEQRFVHIRYLFVEALADEEWHPPVEDRLSESDRESLQVQLSEEDKSALERPPTVLLADPTLYFLDDEDMAELQGGLEDEKGRALFVEVLTCVRELLLDPIVEDIAPALEMVADIHAEYLRDQIYRRVIEIQEIFEPYLASEAADGAARDAFDRMKLGALDAATLSRLGNRLLAGELDEEEAGRFVRAFGSGRLREILTGLPDIKRVCQYPALARALTEIAGADERGLRESLSGDNPGEAASAAFIVGLTGDSRHLDVLGETLSSPDPEVRREALLALKSFGGGRALDFVSRAIDDGDPSIRLYALRHLVSHRYAPALPRVVERIGRADAERSLTEQRLLYEAYGALGGEDVVGDLITRFRHRRGLFRKRDPEEAACVLIALGATRSPNARDVLEEASRDRHPLVARVANQVLQGRGAVGAEA